MSIDASAKNMAVIVHAKEVHDKHCPYGGVARRVFLTYFDIERLGWEEGDVIAGLVLVGDANLATGRMRVSCDAEPDGGREESEQREVLDAVAKERELVNI